MKIAIYISIFALMTIVVSLKAQSPGNTTSEMMIGKVKIKDFHVLPYKTWFEEEYKSYVLDVRTLTMLDKIDRNVRIEVYFGSWCGDSKREVPRFIKILSHMKFKNKRIKYIGLDRAKTAPGYDLKEYNIQYVPTFIFFKNGREIGRIIETPSETLEKDILNILSE